MAARETPWFPAVRTGRRAAYRTSRTAVEEALGGVRLAGADLVTADLALSVADLVDAARVRQDPQLLLSAASRLEVLLGKLPLGRGPGVRSSVDDDSSGSVEGVLDEPARLAELVGRAAAVRDAS